MNKYVVLSLVFLVLGSLLMAQSASITYQLSYTDNAFNLSDEDLDKFENKQGFTYIDTSDDLIQTINMRVSHSYRNKNYRISPSISLTQNSYINNSDKSGFNVLTGFNSRIYKAFVDIRYGWYPNNYLRKYKDTDGTQKDENFEYGKNLYKMTVKYPVAKRLDAELYGKSEDYYHNKYFTEYDGNALTTGIGLYSKYQPGILSLYYYFRQFDNKSDNQQMQTVIDTQKDCSYDSDCFEIKYQFPKFYAKSNFVDYSPYFSYRFENVKYTSKHSVSLDPIHATRKDTKIKVNIGTTLYAFKNIDFKLDAIKEFRRVSSEYEKLKYSKNYDKFQINASLSDMLDF